MLHLLFLPSASALTPAARWGHRAAYVDSKQAMYVVGGSVSGAGTQITNEVLVLPLNASSASWANGPNTGLPAHAFASLAMADDTLVVVGGMTQSCASDGVAHALDIASDEWTSASPTSLRRRHGAGAAPAPGGIMVVGGIADKSTCYNAAAAYTGVDTVRVPLSNASVTTATLPSTLTGTKLAVSDFAIAASADTVFLAGGQAADGSLVPLDTVGVWTSSGGWQAQKLRGAIPAGRLGATLVAHPSRDMLILHGGSEYDASTKAFAPSVMLATLDTKTWEWSQPAALQPSAGLAYHTSVVTPSGVMITAFGMGAGGAPTSDVHYLDMRAADASQWSWTQNWSSTLLSGETEAPAAAAASSKSNRTAAIAAPIVILAVLLPLAIWLFRRHQRNRRKRRLASHFSFSTQEDNGGFRNYSRAARSPFADNSWSSNMRSAIDRVFRRGSSAGVGDDGTLASREPEKNWEEIDFGLGRVDEARREATYTDMPRRGSPRRSSFEHPGEGVAFPMPVASTLYDDDAVLVDIDTSPRLGSPRSDGQVLLSPNHEQSPFRDPDSGMADAAADAASVDDWNALARSMESRPAFRPLSPTATLGSHQHAGAPSLPPMEFSGSPVLPASGTRLPHQRVSSVSSVSSSGSPPSVSRHLAGGRRSSVNGVRSISAGSFNRNPNRLSPLRVVNADQQ
ncbi:galactose oxidase [Cutaneotrichosporon oleaginosum]|uniref:Galactose oxidase n=1 Tax=Cutaneotrichosporon oleaginosum TaxID=879819 RepID=A0A0J0XWX8_9TREE|nr:galactose oxidase [Cutaneotrichosporon oleaginosum]KLT45556.1 galactose oxidase [Cutaneotrichosporon oleaginosum]TXT14490.1 hypothetical protein COLE_00683 [Cutaneotrichosporon oleaginosum]